MRDNPLKNAEMSMEDDYGMIDGIVNNGKAPALEEQKKDAVSKKDEPVSILARLDQPLPARNPRDHDKPKKNKEMEPATQCCGALFLASSVAASSPVSP